ncbi:protoporphyrinogen/coproporphyrinogen oxidase [Candidatus Omnitrophota bacterium]
MKKIVIIGAGPTGLGAAHRLKELGHKNFLVYEKNSYPGGLCASFKDKQGFTWDLGGHVIFSHYKYFDKFLTHALGNNYLKHKRRAWIRTMDRWIPYPFQNNLRYLPKEIITECLDSLRQVRLKKKKSNNFKEWVFDNMGKSIAKYFMLPYNFKVWAHPIHMLSSDWINERVSPVKLKDAVELLASEADETDWGPNATFKFPLFGGTNTIFKKTVSSLNSHIHFNSELIGVDAGSKKILLSGNRKESYDILINTSPLDKFIKLIKGSGKDLSSAGLNLKHNGVYIVGIGFNKPCPSNKCWMYFPDKNSPFFRVTYFSNYSPNNVPDSKKHFSLLCESAYSKYKKEEKAKIVEKTIQGLVKSGLIKKSDRKFIISKFLFDIDCAYPIPTLKRNEALREIQTELEKMDMYSRGRFGAWKYEIGNTDHSMMQGKEIVDRLLRKGKEKVWSL